MENIKTLLSKDLAFKNSDYEMRLRHLEDWISLVSFQFNTHNDYGIKY